VVNEWKHIETNGKHMVNEWKHIETSGKRMEKLLKISANFKNCSVFIKFGTQPNKQHADFKSELYF